MFFLRGDRNIKINGIAIVQPSAEEQYLSTAIWKSEIYA
jgi:hypothetical protein